MPKDRNGVELKVGDEVFVLATVQNVFGTDGEKMNCTIVTTEHQSATQGPLIWTLHARLVEKI